MPTNHHPKKEIIMNSLFKTLIILFILSLSALPLTGCDNPPWESGRSLVLNIDTPKDDTTVATSTITVSGHLNGKESAGAKVSVNGADVPVKDGNYSVNITLTEGKNVINILATGGSATLKEQMTVTYAPAKM
jgi:hypothetical protein